MNFRTFIKKSPNKDKINFNDKLFFIGSCFAQNMGDRLSTLKFNTTINPFGVVYNPFSVCAILDSILCDNEVDTSLIVKHEDMFYSLMNSTKIFNETEMLLISDLRLLIKNAHKALNDSNRIVITLGTSWIYRYNENNKVVNNCLKLPASEFTRKRLTVTDVITVFDDLMNKHSILKSKKIIFTISPIRHLKDGLIENSLSKAILLVAVNELVEKYDNMEYFPAYEIMNDDLRDYRFYESDMIHPSPVAIDYIFEQLNDCWFDSLTKQFCKDNESLINAVKHRPTNPMNEKYVEFCKKNLKKIEKLSEKYESISYLWEQNYFEKKINKKNE